MSDKLEAAYRRLAAEGAARYELAMALADRLGIARVPQSAWSIPDTLFPVLHRLLDRIEALEKRKTEGGSDGVDGAVTYTLPVGTLLTCEGGHVVGEVIEELWTGRLAYAACLGNWRISPAPVPGLPAPRCWCGERWFVPTSLHVEGRGWVPPLSERDAVGELLRDVEGQ